MIGTIISMHYVGKKRWIPSIVFWVVYFVIMAIVSAILTQLAPEYTMLSLVVSAAVFIILAVKWYKFNLMNAVKVFAIAFIIDLVLAYLVIAAIVGFFGFVLPSWLPFIGV